MDLQIIKQATMQCDKGFVTLGRNMGMTITLPVYCFLVKHPMGNVLIDTGISNNFRQTWGIRLKSFLPKIVKDLAEELEGTHINYIINTHLHLDHADNNHQYPDAQIFVQKDEFEAANHPPKYQKFAYADHFKKGNYKIIQGNYDVFGDCSIHILKTPGHTKGHQSILLNLDGRKIFIAGDACYTKENLKFDCLPGFFWNADKVMENYDYIRNLKDTQIIFGHGK